MDKKKLKPDQIITLNDYPIRNEQILKIYFRLFLKGQDKIVPPVPVIHKSTGIPLMKGKGRKVKKYNNLLSEYLDKNPKVEYFLLDGTHKTTVATLSHKLIPVMIFKSNKDIKEAKNLVKKGELISLTTGNSIKEILKILRNHFFKTMTFQTVADKTKKLVQNRKLPKYMIDYYNKNF